MYRLGLLVGFARVRGLLLSAKHLFFAANYLCSATGCDMVSVGAPGRRNSASPHWQLAPLPGGAFSVVGRCATDCGIVSVRCVQPMVRLGVEVVGLPPHRQALLWLPNQAHLAPLPCGGAFVCVRRVGTPTTETNAPARRLRGGLAGLARRGLATTTSTFSGVPDRQAYHPPP